MPEPEDPSTLRVLLAEDCGMSAKLACAFLERLGCKVTIACDGREACRASQESRFDVIFMDCEMPEMGGHEATREIRAREQASGSPRVAIVALTASGRESDRDRCLAAGMDDLLEKPYRREELRLALLRHVTQHSRQG
jgi:CheY-like chemotaxis protein